MQLRERLPASFGPTATMAAKRQPEVAGQRQAKKQRQHGEDAGDQSCDSYDDLVHLQIEQLFGDIRPTARLLSRAAAAVRKLRSCVGAAPECPVCAADVNPHLNLHNSSAYMTWTAPTKIEIVGSFAHGTSMSLDRQDHSTWIVDVAMCMPRSCVQAKDYLDHRYTDKRTLYLCKVYQLLCSYSDFADVSIEHFYGDENKPVVVARPCLDRTEDCFLLRILICLGAESRSFCSRLLPSRSLNRRSNQMDKQQAVEPTPHYNNSILEDLLMLDLVTEIKERTLKNAALVDGILLAKVWVMRRRLDASYKGIQAFQLSFLICYLYDIGAITDQMTAWQIFKSFLTYVGQGIQLQKAQLLRQSASHPLLVSGGILSTSAACGPPAPMAVYLSSFEVVLLNSSGQLNVMGRLSKNAFAEVQMHANISLALITGEEPANNFSKLFLMNLEISAQFDLFASISVDYSHELSIQMKDDLRDTSLVDFLKCKLTAVVCRALGQRAELVRMIDATASGSAKKALQCTFGVYLNSQQAERLVDIGPAASDEMNSKEFRDFWKSKAELRRLKDGSIVQAVVWSDTADDISRQQVINSVLKTALSFNMNECTSATVEVADGGATLVTMLGQKSKVSEWQRFQKAFDSLSKMIRRCYGCADGLPLAVVRVVTTSARFAGCSVAHPRQHPLIEGCVSKDCENSILARPASVLIEFESSGQWPSDDVRALRAIKLAMMVRLAETLKAQFNIETHATRHFIDIFAHGFVFRARVSHSREIGIIQEDILKIERALSATDQQRHLFEAQVPAGLTAEHLPSLYKEVLSLERMHVYAPLHMNMMGGLLLKHPAAAKTIRLVKRWLHSHMFSGLISDRAVELIVCFCFSTKGAAPYYIPSTQLQGFLRFLKILYSFDWAGSPMVVSLDADSQSLNETLDAARNARASNTDVPVFIVTDYANGRSVWTDSENPSLPIVQRLQKFAKATAKVLQSYMHRPGRSSTAPLSSIFTTPSQHFDVLIRLNVSMIPGAKFCANVAHRKRARRAVESGPFALPQRIPKNLMADANDSHEQIVVGMVPAKAYVEELRAIFGTIALFFLDELGGSYIGVKWKPDMWIPHRGRNGLKLQTFKYSLLVPRCRNSDSNHPEVCRNVFEILEQIRVLGEGLVERIEMCPHAAAAPKTASLVTASP
eukprot:SAG31_NODE_776_length_12175_cov_9.349122_7_plen_1171_part_00